MKQTTQEYRDRDGNKIGTQENVNDAFGNVLFNVDFEFCSFNDKKFVDVNKLKDKINTYLAVRYCYKEDTSDRDNNLNNIIQQLHGFAKYIGYKPIKTN